MAQTQQAVQTTRHLYATVLNKLGAMFWWSREQQATRQRSVNWPDGALFISGCAKLGNEAGKHEATMDASKARRAPHWISTGPCSVILSRDNPHSSQSWKTAIHFGRNLHHWQLDQLIRATHVLQVSCPDPEQSWDGELGSSCRYPKLTPRLII